MFGPVNDSWTKISVAGNGAKIPNEHGFLGVQPKKPGFASSHPLSNKKPFATSHPVGPQSFVLGQHNVEHDACNGVCMAKELCVNGILKDDNKVVINKAAEVSFPKMLPEAQLWVSFNDLQSIRVLFSFSTI